MLVAIFAFVRTPDDIVPYATIMSATTIINYLPASYGLNEKFPCQDRS